MTSPIETRILREPEARPLLTMEHVRAQIIRSSVAAFALATVVSILCAQGGVSIRWSVFWASLTASIYLAVRMAVHDYADDVRDGKIRAEWEAAIDDLTEQVEAADEELATKRAIIESVRADAAQLRYELGQLRKGQTPSFVPQRAPEAAEQADAEALIEYRYNTGRHPSRDTLRGWGWPDSRIVAAIGALTAAGVLDMTDAKHPRWTQATGEAALVAWRSGAATLPLRSPQHAATNGAGEGSAY